MKVSKILFIALLASLAVAQDVDYQVVVLKEGDNTNYPSKGQKVQVHYEGRNTLSEGVFDSSYKRNSPLSLTAGAGMVIKCWDDILTGRKLSLGGKVTVKCPAWTAYGERGAGGVIKPNEDLIFDMELISIGQ